MASSARIDELKKKFDENPRRYFAPLANEFRKAGDIEQALIICEEFLPQQPGHMSGHIVYGQALFEAGRLPEAQTVFETALGLDPENLIALRHLGDIARAQGDQAAARGWYVRVLDADPRNEEIQGLIATLDPEAGGAPQAVPPEAADTAFVEAVAFERADDLANTIVAPAVEEPVLAAPFARHVPAEAPDLIDDFSLDGLETTPETSELMPAVAQTAEGLEPTEFIPPAQPVAEADDLDATLESGVPSFSAPAEPVASLEGLEGSDAVGAADVNDDAFAPLEFEGSFVLPPSEERAPPVPPPIPEPTAQDDDLLDFEMPQEVPAAVLAGEVAIADAAGVEFSPPTIPEMEIGLETAPEGAAEVEPTAAIAADESIPEELPPAVIAGEAAIEAAEEAPPAPAPEAPGDSVIFSPAEELSPAVLAGEVAIEEAADEVTPPPAAEGQAEVAPKAKDEVPPVSGAPFVTETMAELYLAQGFRDQALGVYQQLLSANPSDERLRGLVDSLSMRPAAADEGPTVREFFARIAARRPGSRGAAATPPADDDFSMPDAPAAPESEPAVVAFETEALESVSDVVEEAAPEEDAHAVAPAIERAAAMNTPAGSIDALFGNRPTGTSEDSAASALAQAFGGAEEDEAPAITGRPARAATGELSLDSVFRDGHARPPRASQNFSFDQFFAEGAATSQGERASAPRNSSEVAMPGEPPAERSADDIEQFNSWLQGLKPR